MGSGDDATQGVVLSVAPVEAAAMWSAIGAVIGAVLSAVIVQLLARNREAALKHLEYRLDKYGELLAAFAAMGGEREGTYDVRLRFAEAMNTVMVPANAATAEALVALQAHVARHGTTLEEQNRVVDTLIRAIRRELGSENVPNRVLLSLVSPGRSGSPTVAK